jgi:Rrf2 family protein
MKYLQRLLTDLSKAGFIVGSRGRAGGFVFAKKPDEIHLSEVVDAIEDMKEFNVCIMGVTDCQMTNKCILHDSWEVSRNLLVKSLTDKTLSDFQNSPNVFE